MARSDLSELATRLGEHAEAVCRRYLPAGRRRGNYWQVGDARNTPGRSMFVRLKDSPKGPAGNWQEYVAPKVMLRLCDLPPSHRRLTASTQHNGGALRGVHDASRRL